MAIENGMNDAYVNYFSLEEYINQIKLLPFVLEHLEDTSSRFDSYMKSLSQYDKDYISNFFIESLYLELKSNQAIENHSFDINLVKDEDLLFDRLTINNKRIHALHNFAIKKEIEQGLYDSSDSYRKTEVSVSRYNFSKNEEEIFWRGAKANDLTQFMNDFIKIYRKNGVALLYSNPFLLSSLIHLLFVRIHPYVDGNGRTARMIHNIKFTEMVNKLYGTRLKLSPLNLSKSILINKRTYVNRLNNIYFDLEHDSNEDINKWFNFILDMADEQLYFSENRLGEVNENYIINKGLSAIPVTMRLSRIKNIH